MGCFFRKSSNDTQENSKDAQGREEALKKVQEENTKLKEANTELNRERNDLAREKDKLASQNAELTEKNKTLTTEKDNLNNQLNASQKRVNALEQSQQVLENEKVELTNKITDLSKEKDNLTKANTELTDKNKALTTEKEKLNTDLSNAKSQVIQANQEKENLEQKHAPYKKLEKLYEVFLEVKGCLNFNFVATTHSAMDLIAYVLSDSKYYLESLYNKASQELSDKKSDKGEKLAELFDLLFEYIKDKKFERLKEPSAYDYTCKSLYPEQNTSQKMQRVVLIGYTYDKKTPPYYTIVDMGS
ncbi:hypothetical protein CV729_01320 [Helicobacter pylori]|uniref:hypothetical protein n=1 Tax=Helicobacter pylori TaxID=210 RepID=UPI0011989DF5|nr:hypothetical protein [Helicobacter pylori]QDY61769.1 hypothetical protein CV729_01320 [Helicobacter pylori]